MKNLLLLIISLIPFPSNAQLTFELKGTIDKKISSVLTEGSQVELSEIRQTETDIYKAIVLKDGNYEQISVDQLDKITFKPRNSKEFWQNQAIQNSVYSSITKNGLQYKLRYELEEDALEYMNYVNVNNLIFEDSYLESYLYTLIYKILPNRLDDGRPGIINVKLLKDISPNSFVFPNGTLFITTGLLSTINSEDELVAVLAHEISHFVLDHSIININKAIQRQKSAEFWAAFATGVAAAADIYVSSNNAYYSPGTITMGTAILAFSIAESVNERLGIKYSKEQESTADECATELLKFLSISPSALSTALNKIKKHYLITGNYLALYGAETHPSIDDRIKEIGEPKEYNSIEYDKKISFINSFNAILELNNQHFSACYDFANRNIKANVATEDDYVLLAMTTIYMNDSEASNKDALSLIQQAKSLNIYPTINILKQEAIVLLRLGLNDEAINSLEQYKNELENERTDLEKIRNSQDWSTLNNYINKEYEWTMKMIYKVKYL